MTALYARNKFREWAEAVTELPFYDTVNRSVDPQEPNWFTMAFYSESHGEGTFCADGYTEHGSIDLIFMGQAGQGDQALLAVLEPALASFMDNEDDAKKLVMVNYGPVEEFTQGSAEKNYRLAVEVEYSFTA